MAPNIRPVQIGVFVAAVAVGNWYGNYKLNKLRAQVKAEREEKTKKDWQAREEAAYQRGFDAGSGKILEKVVEPVGDRRKNTDELGWIDFVEELTEEDFYPTEYK